MNSKMKSFLKWFEDPFGRKKVLSKHGLILTQLREVQIETNQAVNQQKHKKEFPISHMVVHNRRG